VFLLGLREDYNAIKVNRDKAEVSKQGAHKSVEGWSCEGSVENATLRDTNLMARRP